VEHYTKEIERLIKTSELEARKSKAAAYVDPEKALAAKERGNDHFRAGNWPDAIKEYEVHVSYACDIYFGSYMYEIFCAEALAVKKRGNDRSAPAAGPTPSRSTRCAEQCWSSWQLSV
jgi:hypothetical protein